MPFGFRRKSPSLDWIQLEVSSRCRAQCLYCPHHAYRARWDDRLFPLDLFRRLVPDLRRTRYLHLQGWGEPLLHPEIVEFVRIAKRAGLAVGTTTGGRGLDGVLADALTGAGLDVIAFSLAGTDERQDALRPGTTLAGVRQAVAHVRQARADRCSETPHVHVAFMLLRSRLDEIERLPWFLASLGAEEAVVGTLSLVVDDALVDEAVVCRDRREYEALRVRCLAAVARAEALGVRLEFQLALPFVPPGTCAENVGRSAVIGVAGEIAPCMFARLPLLGTDPGPGSAGAARGPVFGSLGHDSLAEAWRRPAWRAFRGAHRRGRPGPACRECPRRRVVRLGCAAPAAPSPWEMPLP